MIDPICRTRVWRQGKIYDVSTINRESSAMLSDEHMYAETMVFEVLPNGMQGELLGQDEAASGSIFAHQRMVSRIYETGYCEMPEQL